MQDDGGTSRLVFERLNGELTIRFGDPACAARCRLAGLACQHLDLIGHDEGRVEPHAELADQLRIFLLVARQALEEIGRTGLGDGAEVRDRLLAGHADAVVPDREGSFLGVVIDPDLEL